MFDFLENISFSTKKDAVQYGATLLLERNMIEDTGVIFDHTCWDKTFTNDEEDFYWETGNDDEYYMLRTTRQDEIWKMTITTVTVREFDPESFWYE